VNRKGERGINNRGRLKEKEGNSGGREEEKDGGRTKEGWAQEEKAKVSW
jgi:hypothetical protein